MRVAFTIVIFCVLLFPLAADGQELPPVLKGFAEFSDRPVFTGRPGEWDELIRERGWILKQDDLYRMWYTGYRRNESPRTMKLGYATSRDGVTWKRHSDSPIYEETWVEDMIVLFRDGTYHMFAEGAGDQAHRLTSTDGIKWHRVGTLDIRLTDGRPISAGPFGTPTVFEEDGTWYLFYERRDQGIWLATSRDLKTWTNVCDDPLIVPGPSEYDRLMIAMNQVVKIDGRFYAVMHGTGTQTKPRDWCTYFCVSDDLRHWRKCADGPVLPIGDNKSSGVLVPEGAGFRLYTMHAAVHVHGTTQ